MNTAAVTSSTMRVAELPARGDPAASRTPWILRRMRAARTARAARTMRRSVLAAQRIHIGGERRTRRLAVACLEGRANPLVLIGHLGAVANAEHDQVDRRLQRLDDSGRGELERRVGRALDQRA